MPTPPDSQPQLPAPPAPNAPRPDNDELQRRADLALARCLDILSADANKEPRVIASILPALAMIRRDLAAIGSSARKFAGPALRLETPEEWNARQARARLNPPEPK